MKSIENFGFVINWDDGERYYQIHIFEDLNSDDFIQISSKINKEDKIRMVSRGIKQEHKIESTVKNDSTKVEFKKTIDFLKKELESAGYIHKFIDLNNCDNLNDAIALLTKSDSRFKIKIEENPS